jgi:hypothetical protein
LLLLLRLLQQLLHMALCPTSSMADVIWYSASAATVTYASRKRVSGLNLMQQQQQCSCVKLGLQV